MEFLEEKQRDLILAQEMVRNSLASDINDALAKIEERRNIEADKVKEPANSPANKPIPKVIQEASSGHLDERYKKIEDFLQRFDKFFSKFYEETNTKLSDLTKKMNELSARVNEKPSSAPAAKSPAAESKKKPENPSDSKFGTDDVAIEKIFSNANNKMMKPG